MESLEFRNAAMALAEVGRFLAKQGWSPATSSNYSMRLSDGSLALTRSGIDKFHMQDEDVIHVSASGEVIAPSGAKSSAETLIHTTIYENRPAARAVLHTHSLLGTRLSLKFLDLGKMQVGGYEILKGLNGNQTHEMEEVIPVLANDQNMQAFAKKLLPVLNAHPRSHGFLIAGHGLYTWGENLAEAKRHIETFEFLFQCVAYEQLGI